MTASNNHSDDCPFCVPNPANVIDETATSRILWDSYPVSPGHALIVPKTHILDWFAAPAPLQAELATLIAAAKSAIQKHHQPDGYNIGFNAGAAAGQTVFHLHIHVIPRYAGDSDDPRGGVRWVIPTTANYWGNE